MTDEQFDSMIDSMSPEMLKMSLNMAKQNPQFVNDQLRKQQEQAQNNTSSGQTSQGASGAPNTQQADGGLPNMNNMEEMMNNPMVKEMMNNPEMMKMAMDMMKNQGGAAGGAAGAPQ